MGFFPKGKLSIAGIIVIGLVVIFSASVGYLFGYATPRTVDGSKLPSEISRLFSTSDSEVDLNVLESVWDTVHTSYVDSEGVKNSELYYGMLKGLVAGLGDPYTIFLDPEETDAFSSDLEGSFQGIGAEIAVKENKLTVVAPLSGSPAEKAGLRANDVIEQIDGEMTIGLDVEVAVQKIRGPKGSTVTLTIIRNEEPSQDVVVTRDTITIKSVVFKMTDDVGVITISSFTEKTRSELLDALREASLQSAKGLVLDLRNNPGGLLEQSVDAVAMFVPKDTLAVIERSSQKDTEHKTTQDGLYQSIPLIVLVNGGSASASEIVAGALQDHGRAKIIGEQTFGKGTVQSFEVLSDGSSLKMTVAEWHTPKDRSINEQGITPDILVPTPENGYTIDNDPQLDQAITEVKKTP